MGIVLGSHASILGNPCLLFLKVADDKILGIPLFLDSISQLSFKATHLFMHLVLHSVELAAYLLSFTLLIQYLVPQEAQLRVNFHLGNPCPKVLSGTCRNQCTASRLDLVLQHLTVNLDLFERVGDFVLHLSAFDLKFLELVSQLDLPGLRAISGPYRAFLHRLELAADVLDQLLLLVFDRLDLTFDLLWEFFLHLKKLSVNGPFKVQHIHFQLPHLELLVHCGCTAQGRTRAQSQRGPRPNRTQVRRRSYILLV